MKKINLLFDATIFVETHNIKNANRSGIYWVAYNVFIQFVKSPLYNISIYISNISIKDIFFKRKIPFLNTFNIINYYDIKLFKNNIKMYIKRIIEKKSLTAFCIYSFKILKDLIKIIFAKIINKKIHDINVFLSPVYTIPDIIKNNIAIKSFHILYDCVPIIDNIDFPPNDPNHWFSILYKNLNKNTYYFCISECTKKDFLKAASNILDKEKLFVSHIAASQEFYPDKDIRKLKKILLKYNVLYNNECNYIFSFCTIDPRKNLIFTINCFIKFIKENNIDDLFFYLGGGYFDTYIKKFKQEITNFSEYKDKIIFLGYVDDEDVNVLYSNSLFFTYLSQYEGFGLPPLEAMKAGVPVITSNNSSLPEVVGDAAISIDYNNESQCIKAFKDFYYNNEIRDKYIKKGLERANLFSWNKTFDVMDNKIKYVLGNEYKINNPEDDKKKILILFHINFLRRDMGCANGVYTNVKMLKDLGFTIDFFSTNIVDDFNDFSLYNKENIINKLYLVDNAKRSKIKENISFSEISWTLNKIVLEEFRNILKFNNYDYIYVHYIIWAELFQFTKIPANTKIIYNMHDSYFIHLFYHKGIENIGNYLEEELKLLNIFDKYLCASHDEMLFWSKFFPEKKFYFLPAVNEFKKINNNKIIDVLYIAANNQFNITAAIWFIDNVCKKLDDNIKITFCGKFLTGLSKEYFIKIKELNIETIDFAENLDELYSITKVVVVPILSGTGLKIKTLEAMYCSIPIVSTVLGVDGLPDKFNNGCLVTNDPNEFAFYIKKLLNDENYYKMTVSKQDEYYRKYLSYEKNIETMKEVFEL